MGLGFCYRSEVTFPGCVLHNSFQKSRASFVILNKRRQKFYWTFRITEAAFIELPSERVITCNAPDTGNGGNLAPLTTPGAGCRPSTAQNHVDGGYLESIGSRVHRLT